MTPAHGTRARYNTPHSCRCDACKAAGKRYRTRRTLAELTDTPSIIDATPAREHLLKAQANGVPVRVMAARTGLHDSTLQEIRRGHRTRTSRTASDRILAASIRPDRKSYVEVDATGTVRRLRALATLGWSTREIAARAGVSHKAVAQARRGAMTVKATTRDRIATVYRSLLTSTPVGLTPRQRGGITTTRDIARRNGWAGPLAWDDIDHDEAPTDLEPYRATSAAQNTTELAELGLTPAAIASRLNVKEATVYEYLRKRQVAA